MEFSRNLIYRIRKIHSKSRYLLWKRFNEIFLYQSSVLFEKKIKNMLILGATAAVHSCLEPENGSFHLAPDLSSTSFHPPEMHAFHKAIITLQFNTRPKLLTHDFYVSASTFRSFYHRHNLIIKEKREKKFVTLTCPHLFKTVNMVIIGAPFPPFR